MGHFVAVGFPLGARREPHDGLFLGSILVVVGLMTPELMIYLSSASVQNEDVGMQALFGGGTGTMRWQDRIGFDPGVLGGKPVIKGTRLAVEKIVELMASGWTEQQIAENYPGVTRDDIAACLFYASEVLKSERVVTLATSH